MRLVLTYLLILLSNSAQSESSCGKTFIELPNGFELIQDQEYFHSGYEGCDFSTSFSKPENISSSITVAVNTSLNTYKIDFNEEQSSTIALYNAYQQVGINDNVNESHKPTFVSPFKKIISEQQYYCYKHSWTFENYKTTTVSCFRFDHGVDIEISFTHHSDGKISIEELENAMKSFKYDF